MVTASEFEGKVVLITGAGGPLGSELVKAFKDVDATVCAAKRNPEAEDVHYEPEGVQFYPGDFTDEKEVKDVFNRIADDHGRLDAVCHNVGEWEGGQPLEETPVEEFDFLLDINLKTAFLTMKHAIPHLQQTNGSLVAVSAMHALRGEPDDGPYRAVKSGVCRLTETMAAENQGSVRANAVLPTKIEYPAEIAESIVFLCSDSNEVVSGASIPVDGKKSA